jgi:hypothetical protein
MDMPSGALALEYTFLREHPLVHTPPNALIHEIAEITSSTEDVAGRVLVVQRSYGLWRRELARMNRLCHK